MVLRNVLGTKTRFCSVVTSEAAGLLRTPSGASQSGLGQPAAGQSLEAKLLLGGRMSAFGTSTTLACLLGSSAIRIGAEYRLVGGLKPSRSVNRKWLTSIMG
jgi:hypothetical protein